MHQDKRLKANNLSCVRQQKELFSPISFQLADGEVLLVEGLNGSGKSSLLRLLTGLATPSAGDIFWHNQLIQDVREDYWNSLHYVGHTNGIKLGLTVNENLRLACHLSCYEQFPSFSTKRRDHESLLFTLQLSAYAHTQARFLSAGQKRRLALAKLFLIPKPLWILDEPLTALDTATQTLFLTYLETHLKSGGMAVISSHHPLHIKEAVTQTLRLASC